MYDDGGTFSGDISHWDVSSVTTMESMFQGVNFSGDLSSWDVSSVTTMEKMFRESATFNQDISNWEVGSVTLFNGMFQEATSFNQPLGSWDVSMADDLTSMFFDAAAFNQDLSGWCVPNFAAEPVEFSDGSGLTPENMPVWGTCPDGPPPPTEEGFSLAMTVQDQQPNDIELVLGTHPDATDGFDNGLDMLAPPPPPDGAFDARLVTNGQSFFTSYLPLTTNQNEWLVKFEPASGAAPIQLSWSAAQLPVDGLMLLQDNVNGSFVDLDMRSVASYTVEQAFLSELKVSHLLQTDPPVFDVPSGSYTGTVTVSITAPTSFVDVLYTTDGSDPSADGNGTLYEAPFDISQSTTVKAVTALNGVVLSEITEAVYNIADFYLELDVSDAANNLVLGLGTSSQATDGYDEGSDVLLPPPPPDGAFDARILAGGLSYQVFYRPTTTDRSEWVVAFAASSGNAPVQLSWDPLDLPEEGTFRMKDNLTGTLLSLDMRTQSSVTIEQAALDELVLVHALEEEITQTYQSGWDLVSLPLTIGHTSFSELFPGSVASSLYSYSGSYVSEQVLTAGNGYWLNFTAGGDVTFQGTRIGELSIEIAPNWNLIAAGSDVSVPVDPDGVLLPGSLYGYNGAYSTVSQLEPGKGYWVASNNGGTVTMTPAATGGQALMGGKAGTGAGVGGRDVNGGLASEGVGDRDVNGGQVGLSSSGIFDNGRALSDEQLNLFHAIQFWSGEDLVRTLYLGGSADGTTTKEDQKAVLNPLHPLQLSLPPLPPSGRFDVRFDDHRWITERSEAPILLQGVSQEIVLQNASNAGMEVKLKAGPQMLPAQYLKPDGTLIISEHITGAQVQMLPGSVTDDQATSLPVTFALSGNYPNPFNPVTTIQYSVPETADVQITVYNVLGQPVSTLVDGQIQPGSYEAVFDASGMSTGVYFVQMRAGSFSAVQKMMLLK